MTHRKVRIRQRLIFVELNSSLINSSSAKPTIQNSTFHIQHLQLQVSSEDLVPRQTLLVELLHERIGIELLDVPNARLAPQTLEEHHGTDHCRNAGGIAYALHTGLLVGSLVRTVVVNVVGLLLTVLQTADAATDRGLSVVVLAEVLGVR